MRPARPRLSYLAALAGVAALVAWPVIGQQGEAPRSLLPDTFGPAPAPDVVAPPPPMPRPAAPVEEPVVPPAAGAPAATAEVVDPFKLPPATGAAIGVAGPLTPAMGGYGLAAFSGSSGVFLAGLMQRVQTPLASRWAHIVLRRALLTQSDTPSGIAAGDWIARRAALLLRMGEADGAVMMVDAVAVDRYTPLLYRVAGQAHLATADIAGLCPLAANGGAVSPDPLWRLAEAMCGGMSGDDLTAASTFDRLRGADSVDQFDLQLAERISKLSGGTGRASNIEWETAPPLTPYRFGLAVAAGVRVPDDRLAGLGAAQSGWVLRAPGVSDAARLAALWPAAALGIASAQEMVSTISAATAGLEGDALATSPGGSLRNAYVATSLDNRFDALRTILNAAGDTPRRRYAALVETAMPAARLPVSAAHAGDAPDIVAALMSAGMTNEALRWWRVVEDGDAGVRGRVWAQLAATGAVPVTTSLFADWRKSGATDHRARLLLASLDGLGRTRAGDWSGVREDLKLAAVSNSWTRAIAAAAAGGRTGEVAVLAATGLQCDWTAVPPAHLGQIVAAYARVGREHEAALIAAEAAIRG
ncbi:hypothetical protein [Glacieibacterium sp.]|uniref:hypothetical protein n=1 Tax=Glacieibacterium sp. TaxID=2860237 RepID=UPI003AFFF55C